MPTDKKMKNDEIIKFLDDCYDECEEQTRDIRKTWDVLFSQYMCRKDFSKKKKWQFKVYTPISKPVIKKATRLIKRYMMKASDYFDFKSPRGSNSEAKKLKTKMCNLTKRALRVHFDAAKFVEHFADALESGFTMALMILKFWVADEECNFYIDAKEGEAVYDTKAKLKVKAIDPRNFFFTMDKSIQIENEWITLPELNKMVEDSKDDEGETKFDEKELKKLKRSDYNQSVKLKEEDEKRLKSLGINEHPNDHRKNVLLSHFWGPLINKENEIIKENVRFIVANRKFIILPPETNPFWHKKSPYVFESPLKVIFRHIGKGLTEDIASLEDAIVDFVNMQLDNLMWLLLGVNEVDELAFGDKGRAQLHELYPGKLVTKRTGYQGDAFKHHDVGVAPEKGMPMLQELKTFQENEHGVTDYVNAISSAGADTATEYSGKRSSALGDFQSIAQDIVNNFLVDCVDRGRDLMIQYLADFESYPNISSLFDEEGIILDGLTEAEKMEMVVTDLDFVGRGVSIFFEREEKLNKLGAYVKYLNAIPEGRAQYYPKWPEILKRINDAFAFDRPEELINTDDEVDQLEAQMKQQAMQQMMIAWQQQQSIMKNENQENQKDREVDILKIMKEFESKNQERTLRLVESLIK